MKTKIRFHPFKTRNSNLRCKLGAQILLIQILFQLNVMLKILSNYLEAQGAFGIWWQTSVNFFFTNQYVIYVILPSQQFLSYILAEGSNSTHSLNLNVFPFSFPNKSGLFVTITILKSSNLWKSTQ